MKKFAINPICFMLWGWFLFFNGFLVATNYLFAIVVHEYGHKFVAKKCGYFLSRFSISPYGFELGYYGQDINFEDETKIAIAGPLANIISSIFVCGLWWIFPSTYVLTNSFVYLSVLLALFNLLPAYPMDGGRIFVSYFSRYAKRENVQRVAKFLNLVLSLFFLILFVFFAFSNFNPSLLLMSIFMIVGLLNLKFETQFEKINIFTKVAKSFSKPIFLYVKSDEKIGDLLKKIETKRVVIFCLEIPNGRVILLSEKMVQKLSINYEINKKLSEIIKKY